MRTSRVLQTLRASTLLIAFILLMGAAKPSIVGSWTIDPTRSVDTIPKAGKRTSTGVQVGVYGMPVPVPGGAQAPALGTPRDPDVIQAAEFSIEEIDGGVHLRFASRELELTQGDKQGVKTKWRGDRLTTSYQTTRRTVSQDYRLTGPNELTVVVKIDPKDEKARTYTRVFTRKP